MRLTDVMESDQDGRRAVGKDRERFLTALNMLGRSAARLEHHHRVLVPLMPLDGARVESLDEPDLTHVEAMLKKFDQFADDRSRRVLPGVLTLAVEPVEEMSQRQALDRLETIGCIKASEALAGLLHLRSRLRCEYPSRPDLRAEAINDAWNAIPDLLELLHRVHGYVVQTGLIAADDLPRYPSMA